MNSEEKLSMENNRYNEAKVYKLQDQINSYFYIGSTCNTLSKRLSWHKQNAKKSVNKNTKVYKYFNSIGWDNVKIVLVEEHYLNNKQELLREEDRVIQMYIHDEKCLNSIRALRTLEQWKEYHKQYNSNNKKKLNQQCRQYYKEHKEEICSKAKEYGGKIITCGCGSEFRTDSKARHERTKKHQAYLHDTKQEAETI